MAEELQHLIDRIRSEGVASGKEQADALLASAKAQAAQIVADAKKAADAERARARTDADAFAARGRETLKQAARDLLLSIGGSVNKLIASMVSDKVGAALTPDTVAQMLVKIAGEYAASGGTKDLVAMVGDADAEALKAGIAKEYKDKLATGLEIQSDRNLFKGFTVGVRGGQVMHDFSKDAIAESLASFLRPELAELVKQAAE